MRFALLILLSVAVSAQKKPKLAEGDTLIAPSALVRDYDVRIQQRQQAIEQSRQQIAQWEKELIYLAARRDETASISDTLVVYKKSRLLEFR